VRIYAIQDEEGICASALAQIDRTSFGLSTWEIPRGPLLDIRHSTFDIQLLNHIIADAKKSNCFAFYFSPTSDIETSNQQLVTSKRHIVPEATRIIKLGQTEEEILKQMKQKGRYNIRVAEKHGVEVIKSEDVDTFYELIEETAKRDKFKPLPKSHYKAFVGSLDGSFLLLANHPQQKKPIAGLLGVVWGEKGIYYYGASSYTHRACMAPYLLQWEAMRFCKEEKCTSYDLFGIAPLNAPTNHPWKGVTEFKEKFGGEVITYPEEKMIVLKPVVNFVLQTKRKFFY